MVSERRKLKRRKFTYYMRVIDANTLQPIGHLIEISITGIRVDSEKPLPVNVAYKLRVDLSQDVANKTFMVFDGRSKWCQMDRVVPNLYNIGFEVSTLSEEDSEIFQRMVEKYGSDAKW
jgi:hypothetical protein